MKLNHSTVYQFGTTEVNLSVDYSHVRGALPTRDDPGWPAEIDIYSIHWREGDIGPWNEVPTGQLFDLMMDDLYEELCDAAEMEMA